ncbi:MAG: hypothetical protein ABI899_09140 [Actinomycetota bacterium]
MSLSYRSGGVTVAVEAPRGPWQQRVVEACAGQVVKGTPLGSVDIHVRLEVGSGPFPVEGMDPLTRGAWVGGERVVIEDACASGLDLRFTIGADSLAVEARPRPRPSQRGLALLAPGRTQLLWRAAILQYPVLWWAGVKGGVPMHVSALSVDGEGVVLAGPGGVGKSTLLAQATSAGAQALSDNLCVCFGSTLYGVLEPLRTAGGTGRRMPHGRRETAWAARLEHLDAGRILVLRRGSETEANLVPIPSGQAARVIAAGTYAAGELRRYWAFASTLALGTGLGPAHPPVVGSADDLANGIPCSQVQLPATPSAPLIDLIDGSRAVGLGKQIPTGA